MARIEDYAVIGDCRSAALVSRGGVHRLAVLAAVRFRAHASLPCWGPKTMVSGALRRTPNSGRAAPISTPP